MNLDIVDKKIVKLLQIDAKQTTKMIANKAGLSVTAVYERIKRLERTGVIERYVAILDKKKADKGFMVLCQVKLEKHSKLYLSKFESEVLKINEIIECFHVPGDYDYILKIVVKDMEEYREFMVNKLTTLAHVGSTHSTFVISAIKNSTSIHL